MPRHNKTMQVALPKWPAMTVRGDGITREQAAEVLVRTTNWEFGCNDRAWEQKVWKMLGLNVRPEYPHFTWDELKRVEKELGVLSLSYLNNSQVMSAWVGGAHGWLTWRGQVGSTNYNIGKWPSVEAVRDEWRMIAEEFPYLNLRCQLWSEETSEVRPTDLPLVEYMVRNGKVRVRSGEKATDTIRPTAPSFWVGPERERGTSEDVLREAIELTRQRVAERTPLPTVWDRLVNE